MKKYTLFWLTGRVAVVEGNSISHAVRRAGFGAGALRALDFQIEGDKRDEWKWDANNKTWKKV